MKETTDAALVSCQAEKGELRMLVGCYYRCPIVIEEGDKDHPRFYVLAQLDEYNEIADAIKVKMHDLLGSRQYYEEIFQHNVSLLKQLLVVRLVLVVSLIVDGDEA